MFKKISILTLLLLFFVSTSGLPLTIHFCSMEKTQIVEIQQKCNCRDNRSTHMHKACPLSEIQNNSKDSAIKSQNCCESEAALKYIKDSFLTNNKNIQKEVTANKIIVSIIPNTEIIQPTTFYTYTDTSPPPLKDNQIYIYNSILLI